MADDANKGDDRGTPGGKADVDARVAAEVKAMLAVNSAERIVEDLHRKNHDLDRKLREAQGKIPADGSVVLTGDLAKRWEAYQGLGDPAEIRKAVTERDALKTTTAAYEREKSDARVAKIHAPGMEDVVALALKGVDYEFGEAPGKDGKAAPVVLVKGEGDAKTPFLDYVRAQYPSLARALAATPATQSVAPGTPPRGGPGGPVPAPTTDDEYAAQRQTGRYAVT